MAKITRKSYKRKRIVLGISLFASIALVSTGFAAYVLATNAVSENDGKIGVGLLTRASVDLFGCSLSSNEIRFDCRKEDNEGRLKYDVNYPNEQEILTTTISGYIGNADYLSKLTVEIEVTSGILDAEAKKYITLPACANNEVEINKVTFTDYVLVDSDVSEGGLFYGYSEYEVGDTVQKFSYDISFGWGEYFNYENPGDYYDDPLTGGKISGYKYDNPNAPIYEIPSDVVADTMDDLKDTVYSSGNQAVDMTVKLVGYSN